jgi:hypothetical protein
MWQKLLFVFCLILISASTTFSQRHSVTNSDLERYKQKRLQAEREYRENYERLGFPSPDELERRREQSFKETVELSARLRSARIERERIEAAQMALSRAASPYPQYYSVLPDNTIYSGGWINPFFRRHRGGSIGVARGGQSGYFAGGHFWAGGLGTPRVPSPVIRINPRH